MKTSIVHYLLLSVCSIGLLSNIGCSNDSEESNKEQANEEEEGNETNTNTNTVIDGDGDGFNSEEDCDDDNADINPDAEEVCDEVDNNCDGEVDEGVTSTWYADEDGDGFGGDMATDGCGGDGWVDNADDCDDSNPEVNPEAAEICDGMDNDCDALVDDDDDDADLSTGYAYYTDADGDGFGDINSPVEACEQQANQVENMDDCNDDDASINPDAEEVCDSIDNDCDGNVDNGMLRFVFDQKIDYDDLSDLPGFFPEYRFDAGEKVATFQYTRDGNIDDEETADGWPNEVYDFSYDTEGRLIEYSLNNYVDNSEDFTENWSYDSAGNLVYNEYDEENDGSIDYWISYTYDSNNNLVLEQYDSDGDGLGTTYSLSYSYDGNGDLLTKEIDYNNDGIIDARSDYTHTNLGVTSEYYYTLNGETETLQTVTETTYNADGQPTYSEIDYYADYNIDLTSTWTYDSNGIFLSYEVDNNNDGTINGEISREIDANGLVTDFYYYIEVWGMPVILSSSYQYDSDQNMTTHNQDIIQSSSTTELLYENSFTNEQSIATQEVIQLSDGSTLLDTEYNHSNNGNIDTVTKTAVVDGNTIEESFELSFTCH